MERAETMNSLSTSRERSQAARIERARAIRKVANEKFSTFLNALEEHKSEAERNDNPLMADLYGTVLAALYESKGIDVHGKLPVILDLARELR